MSAALAAPTRNNRIAEPRNNALFTEVALLNYCKPSITHPICNGIAEAGNRSCNRPGGTLSRLGVAAPQQPPALVVKYNLPLLSQPANSTALWISLRLPPGGPSIALVRIRSTPRRRSRQSTNRPLAATIAAPTNT